MIKKEQFLGLKPFDRVVDDGGLLGHTWKVVSVTEEVSGRIVVLRRPTGGRGKEDVIEISCRWCDERGVIVDALTGEPVKDLNGTCSYAPPESVERVVEEMLATGKLTQEEADRLNNAGSNNTNAGIDLGCDSH
jgi:hypothetical protein